MRKKSNPPILASDLVKKGHWGNITVTFSKDSRSADEIRVAERSLWKKARIWERPQGFSIVPDGRVVSLCFRKGDKLIDFATELAGTPALDIVIFDDLPRFWIDAHTFESDPVAPSDQATIKADLIAWLKSQGLRFSMGGQVVD